MGCSTATAESMVLKCFPIDSELGGLACRYEVLEPDRKGGAAFFTVVTEDVVDSDREALRLCPEANAGMFMIDGAVLAAVGGRVHSKPSSFQLYPFPPMRY